VESISVNVANIKDKYFIGHKDNEAIVQPDCKGYWLHLSHNPLMTMLACAILKLFGRLTKGIGWSKRQKVISHEVQ
jgi:hypothetical protein|tara:strand:- start:104 stop:331 length:228 start_codon:yes stop_codon:yes gene_type:complete